jgi:hypothetical protein
MAAEQSGGEQPNKPISNIVIVIGMSFFLPSFLSFSFDYSVNY